ncbi:hypothetical protein C8Q70DRAFT_1058441 [Cubamyces menziesii]|nr:hypothetical protein C8Q70DRAFT_1058441 [Cubamyces menziesii]
MSIQHGRQQFLNHIVNAGVGLPEAERRPPDTPHELPTPPSSIPRLVVNRRGRPPSVCSAFDGKVACQGIFTTIIITSPNMDYIPQYPVERQVVPTYTDGRWGLHEYSRCPQVLLSDVWHVACIPRRPSPPELPTVLWENLSVHTHWRIDPRTGVAGLGFILPDVQEDLLEAVRMTRLRLTEVVDGPPESLEYGKYLLMVLSQAVERMEKMPSSAQSAVVVAAHIQRLCLEAEGLRTYMRVVYPRLIGSADYRHDVLPVLGAFVQEGTTAQACTKAGLPVWLLQPLTPSVNIWKVVDPEPLPFGLSEEQCNPPLMHDTSIMSGVVNLTNNWVRDASLRVSKLVAGSRLPTLAPSDVQSILATRDDVHPVKRPKAVDSRREYTHLGMKPLSRSSGETDKERGRKGSTPRGNQDGQVTLPPGGAAGQPMGGHSSPKPAASAEPPQPARFFMQSPFYSIPPHWMRALQSASPVPRSAAQALYFYPPPFLLDTVCPEAPAPELVDANITVRQDAKVVRYLHNLVRIRRFCRARLFNASMSNHPLTITEWRTALFGDYNAALRQGPGTRAAPEQKTRGRRRLEERNGIGRLFGQVALLPPYAADMVPHLGDIDATRETVRTNTLVRSWLLWESHEINFRCEVMALDTLLVQRANWTELERWERERDVSGIWGEPSSLMSVLPPDALPESTHLWGSMATPSWWTSITALCRFIRIVSRWPECPPLLLEATERVAEWDEDDFFELLNACTSFYVDTFVSVYRRLPLPPIPVPV